MKKILISLFLIGCLIFTFIYRNQIVNYILINILTDKYASSPNSYTVKDDFKFVQNTNKNIPYNKQDILNIIFSRLNNGNDYINMVCPVKYKSCISDMKSILYNPTLLSNINSYVHPFNSYSELQIATNNLGEVEIKVIRTYSDSDITKLNNIIDIILKDVIKDNMTDREKIEAIHDYIVNFTDFDKEKSDNINNPNYIDKYNSATAYGALISGYAICAGYTDAMSLFLNRLGIKNYRVASDNHIWNFVYLDNNWYHLDLTWDDQTDTINAILDTYFLITTDELEEINDGAHIYDKKVFIEAQ